MKVFLLFLLFIKEVTETFKKVHEQNPTKPYFKSKWFWFSALSSCVVLIVGIGEYTDANSKASASARTNTFSKDIDDNPIIFFGGNSSSHIRSMLVIGNETVLTAWKSNEKLQILATLKDSKGNIIAAITSDYWKVYSEQIDYNDDDHGFELIRPDHKVIFQCNIIDNRVYCKGIIYSQGVYFAADEGMAMGRMPPVDEALWIPENLNIRPLFKYPRERFQGIRVE